MKESQPGPGGSRFFARIRSFDLACPRCDAVHVVSPTQKGKRGIRGHSSCWDERLGRFRCLSCGLRLLLGVIAYSCEKGGHQTPPSDIVPSPRQALDLRAMAPSVWARDKKSAKGWTIKVNRTEGVIPLPGDDLPPETKKGESSPELSPVLGDDPED